MDVLNSFAIPIIILLGIFSTYTDIRYKLIKNSFVFSIIIIGIGLYILFSFLGYVSNLLDYSILVFIVLCAAFGLYATEIWAAGDGKLFLAFATLLPLSLSGENLYFSIWVFFVNIFIVSFLFVCLIESPFILKRAKKIPKLLISFDMLQEFLFTLAALFCLSWIPRLLSFISGAISPFFFSYVIYFLISRFTNRRLFQVALFSAAFLAGMLLHQIDLSLNTLGYILFFSIPLSFGRKIFNKVFLYFSLKEIKAAELKPGMIIKHLPVDIQKKKILPLGTLLTDENFKLLQQKMYGHETVRVYDTIPLAPFIFFAAVFTLIFKIDIISWFIGLF